MASGQIINEPTPEQVASNFAKWYAAMEASHTMLMAGLRDQVGPDGDIEEAWRQWQAKRRARKLRAYKEAAKRFVARQTKQSARSSNAT